MAGGLDHDLGGVFSGRAQGSCRDTGRITNHRSLMTSFAELAGKRRCRSCTGNAWRMYIHPLSIELGFGLECFPRSRRRIILPRRASALRCRSCPFLSSLSSGAAIWLHLYRRAVPWGSSAAPLRISFCTPQADDIIPPALFFPPSARFWFSTFAIGLTFAFPTSNPVSADQYWSRWGQHRSSQRQRQFRGPEHRFGGPHRRSLSRSLPGGKASNFSALLSLLSTIWAVKAPTN